MNLKRVMDIYNIIKERLPTTYPRPKLAFYEDEESLSKNMRIKIYKGDNLYAVCDPDTNTVMMPLSMTFISTNLKGKSIEKVTPLSRMSDSEIAETLLHEIAHLYAAQRYGWQSKQYHDEAYCDRFARRWVRTLVKERLL